MKVVRRYVSTRLKYKNFIGTILCVCAELCKKTVVLGDQGNGTNWRPQYTYFPALYPNYDLKRQRLIDYEDASLGGGECGGETIYRCSLHRLLIYSRKSRMINREEFLLKETGLNWFHLHLYYQGFAESPFDWGRGN